MRCLVILHTSLVWVFVFQVKLSEIQCTYIVASIKKKNVLFSLTLYSRM